MICRTTRPLARTWATLALLTACARPSEPVPAPTSEPQVTPRAPDTPLPPVASPPKPVEPKPLAVEIVPAPAGPVAQMVAERLQTLGKDRTLLVDVGATWCEPCRRLHDAARQGRLDREFPGLVLIEFDWDRDQDRLRAAGYDSKLLPLLAIPRSDGRMSERILTGSVKGEAAVDGNLVPRLHDLLAGRPAQ